MLDIICTHPLFTIIAVCVSAVVGKYLWVSKDDKNKSEKEFQEELHQLELKLTEKFGSYGEKMRIVQKEIMDESDGKYFTKEMAERHDERISKMEEIISEILPRMQKLDIMYDIVTNNKD